MTGQIREEDADMKKDKFKLGDGVYTASDAACILMLPAAKINRWIRDYSKVNPSGISRDGRQSLFNFLTLVEIHITASLRQLGFSFAKIKRIRRELASEHKTDYPLASSSLLCIPSKEIYNDTRDGALTELLSGGQQAFFDIVAPFCRKLDFDNSSRLAKTFWPLGRDKNIMVSPSHSFGMPVIKGTNIKTEIVYAYHQSGESERSISEMYDISFEQLHDAIEFERMRSAA